MSGDPSALASLLDFSKPFDVALFDKAVDAFFQGNSEIQAVLVQFQNHDQAWSRVDSVLEKSTNPQAKILALNVLENTVKYKWKKLPKDQKEGIKNYIVSVIIKMSSNPENLKSQSVFLRKLNMVLVQIVAQEWPHNWPNFIPELVASSKTSQSLCANNMNVLLLLSEEIFDFGHASMTQEKIINMKKNLNREFTLIFQLCDYILENSQDPTLLSVTLKTLQRFLGWIPVGYIFETKLIQTLALKFFPVAIFQNDTLQCLSEIGSLKVPDHPEYNPKFVSLFGAVMQQVSKMLGDDVDISKVYNTGDQNAQTFIRHLTIFITGFLKAHLGLLESGDAVVQRALYVSLTMLLRISKVNDVVIFKICLEYWNILVADLYNTQKAGVKLTAAPLLVAGALTPMDMHPRVKGYQEILSNLRLVLISKMAKPEEVLIVQDDSGEWVRESLRDTDSITLYKSMRECLIYLTHLDPVDAQNIMIKKLEAQVDGSEYSFHNLNTLCWAIGSISGALSEMAEKSFLVKVIKALLHLCEKKRIKDHKAVIASNIMYVVGQYPRFLRQHWKFLKTVVNKLFEFMHEKHPGVQDMSCETFIKIAKKCRRKFCSIQPNERRPFIEEILETLPTTVKDLEPGQINMFYEAVAEIITAETNPEKKQALVLKLMELPNQSWSQIITQAQHNPSILADLKTVKPLVLVLKTNNRVAAALGHTYIVQLGRIFMELLQVYKMYSTYISNAIAKEGTLVTKTVLVRQMRAVKRETLKLIQTFVENCGESEKELLNSKFIPALMEPVVDDYKRNVPEARDAEVLLLFASLTEKMGTAMLPHLGRVFENTFQVTLAMITKNFEDFPDHRTTFFKLIQAINSHCFPVLLRLSAEQFKLVMDSIIWAMKHLERNISETGLNILFDLIRNMEKSEIATEFYKSYFVILIQDLFAVLTDTFHKPSFSTQAMILAKLFNIVETGAITAPLWLKANPNPAAFPNNQTYVRQFVMNLLHKAFSNLTPSQIEQFVAGLFSLNTQLEKFKTHLRDFLIQLKEFNVEGADNSELFMEEKRRALEEQQRKELEYIKSVPGLLYKGRQTGTAMEEKES